MQLHVLATKHCAAAILEQALAFVRAVDDLLGAVDPQMLVHLATLNCAATAIAAGQLSLGTVVGNVLIHLVEDEACAALEQAVNLAEHALLVHVLLQVFAQDLATALRVGALHWCELANFEMALLVAALDLFVALLVGALDAELEDEAPDRNVRLQRTDDPHVAQGAAARVLDARVAEQIVAAGRLHCVLEDIEADRADPAVV